jgi:hypothetical protein
MLRTKKYELVELIIPANSTGTRYNFPDVPKLRYTAMQAIETFTGDDFSKTATGNTMVTVGDLQKSFLVLYVDGREDLYRIPLVSLHRVQNSATNPFVRALFQTSGQKVTWEKSYIQTSAAFTVTTQFSFLLGVYYEG